MEGTLDAMAIAVVAIGSGVAGRFCPVTQSGRELSATQLEQVASLHGGAVVLGFDGDTAGRESAHRHAMRAIRLGHAVSVTILPSDHDPASWLAERGTNGLKAWVVGAALNRSRPLPAGSCSNLPCSRGAAVEYVSDPTLVVTAYGPVL